MQATCNLVSMVPSAILTPSQVVSKNQSLPHGYQFIPTGFLTVCPVKRKRKPNEELRAPERGSIAKKVPTQEELAAREKQQKIALLTKRLELLKARQLVLQCTPLTPVVESRIGKRIKKPVIKDLVPLVTKTPSSKSTRKTPKPARVSTKKQPKTAKEEPSPAIQQQLATLTSTVANLSKQLAQKPVVERVPKVPKNLNLVALTNREKQTLKADIFKLPSDKLDPVIEMCSRNSGVEDKSEDSITIDIDKLDIPTLRELQKYVKKCINQLNRKKAPKDSTAPKQKQVAPSPIVSPSKPALTPRVNPRHQSDSESESDSTSSSSSDSESELEETKVPLLSPHPLQPTNLSAPFDAQAWSNIGVEVNSTSGSGDGLWSSFRSKEQEQRERELERQEAESRLAADRAKEVDALRRKSEEIRAKQEEQHLRILREREEELDRQERQREREREAARIARQTAERADFGSQHGFFELMDSLG